MDSPPPPFEVTVSGAPSPQMSPATAQNARLNNQHRAAPDFFNTSIIRGISEIVPGFLFLGSEADANDSSTLDRLGIYHFLCCAEEVATPSQISETRHHITRIDLSDTTRDVLQSVTETAFAAITKAREAKSKVLVFCRKGISRSVSVVIAFLMQDTGLNYQNALIAVRKTRPQAEPNANFTLQLLSFEGSKLSTCDSRSSYLCSDSIVSMTDAESRLDENGGSAQNTLLSEDTSDTEGLSSACARPRPLLELHNARVSLDDLAMFGESGFASRTQLETWTHTVVDSLNASRTDEFEPPRPPRGAQQRNKFAERNSPM